MPKNPMVLLLGAIVSVIIGTLYLVMTSGIDANLGSNITQTISPIVLGSGITIFVIIILTVVWVFKGGDYNLGR